MKLAQVVETSRTVAAVSGRLEKIERLGALLRQVPPQEVDVAVSFLTGALRQGRIGVGPSAVWSVRPDGAASEPTLTLADVDSAFDRIKRMTGAGSGNTKAAALRDLYERATRDEQDFIARLLVGELRQGALEGVLLEAIARASAVPAAMLRRAVMMAGDLSVVARAALTEGEVAVSRFLVQLLQPVRPMLATPADTVDDALNELGDASLEFKVDGARVQVHKAGDDIRVFSRHMREVTPAVPEVINIVRALPARELILDGEIIALRPDGTPRPFQETMRRFGRKLDIERLQQEMPLTPFFFDCLYLDGVALLDEPHARRIGEMLGVVPDTFVMPRTVATTKDDAKSFMQDALRRGHEGIMAKSLAAPYAAGQRGRAWFKIKVAKTLDLVILAAEWGSGRRKGWLSNLHLGARDPQTGAFVMLGKTFKGLTDAMLTWQTEKFLSMEIGRDQYTVYVRPELVAEIAFSDVQASPRYPGGLALRFARVKRYRPDKPASEADTIDEVRRIFGSVHAT